MFHSEPEALVLSRSDVRAVSGWDSWLMLLPSTYEWVRPGRLVSSAIAFVKDHHPQFQDPVVRVQDTLLASTRMKNE